MTKNSQVNGLQSLMDPIINNWKLALGILVLILLIVGIKAYTARKYYQLTFFIACNTPFNEELKITEGRLNVIKEPFFSQSEVKVLCSNFQRNAVKQFPELKQLTINTIRTMKENSSFEMVLQVYNTSSLDQIVAGFLEFLNRNEAFARNLELDSVKYGHILKEIDNQLDGVKGVYKEGFLQEKVSLYEKRAELESKLEKLRGFEVTVPPVSPGSYANMSPIKQLILALIWGSIIAVTIAYFAGLIWPKKQ
ncbi:MAG: hypothetical protein AB9842_01055 [Bacteroidales bacterium]